MIALLALTLSTNAAYAGCPTSPPSVLAERLRDAVAVGEYERAVELMRAADADMACLDAFVSADDLAAVYQLAGTAAFYGPKREDAAALFRRAVVVAPNVPFDAKNLGPDAAALYATVKAEVALGATGECFALGPVVVDGTTMRPGSSLVVPIGAHLLQEGTGAGVHTSILDITTGVTVRVGTPDPALVTARQVLYRRQKATFLGSAAALFVTSGGLFALAASQKSAFLELDPEHVDDPKAQASAAELGVNLSTIGAILAAGGGLALGWRGLTLRVDLDPVSGAGSVAVGGSIGGP